MREILDRYIRKFHRDHQKRRKAIALFVVLSLLVSGSVTWRLKSDGIAMTNEAFCGKEEHQHSEACYTEVLTCGLEETEGHHHSKEAGCYAEEKTLICTEKEHTHGDECYDEEGNLICLETEHTHDGTCYQTAEVLACDKPETEGHTHSESCYTKELTCGKEEHIHTAECYSDNQADVETAADWEKTLPADLGGGWAENVVKVAASQLGYVESTKNYQLSESDGTSHKGYARYGAWYGNDYGDWSAMFVSFCLKYAGVPESAVPYAAGAYAWTMALNEKGLYHDKAYTAKAGDIVFLDKDEDGRAERVGVVEKTSEDGKQIKTIEGDCEKDGADVVAEMTYTADDEKIVGYGEMAVNPEAKEGEMAAAEGQPEGNAEKESIAADDAVPEVEEAAEQEKKDGIAVQAVSGGLDITNRVTNVSFKKKNGDIYEDVDISDTEFTTGDQLQANFEVDEIPTKDVQDNDYKTYIELPQGMDASRFLGKEYDAYDGVIKSGKYHYEQDADGKWYIVLELDKNYVDGAGEQIHGSLKFDFQWNDDIVSDDGSKKTISIGSWTGEITVIKDITPEPEPQDKNYSLKKESGKFYYDESGNSYIDYDVELIVKNDGMQGSLTMKDALEAADFAYDGSSLQIVNADGVSLSGTFENLEADKTDIVIGKTGTEIPKGTYHIKYRVKSNKDLSACTSSEIENKIEIKDGEDTIESSKKSTISQKTVSKNGSLQQGADGEQYIEWTVSVNNGEIIKDIKNPTAFSDQIDENLTLVGDVTVIQYDVNGNIAGTYNASVSGNQISYDFPKGQCRYEIKYRTKASDSMQVPIGGTTVSNTAETTGDIAGKDTANVVLPGHVTNKTFVRQNIQQVDGTWADILEWSTEISLDGSLNGYTYNDYTERSWYSGELNGKCLMKMTDQQLEGIKVYDKQGNEIPRNKYTAERYSRLDNGEEAGLFTISFSDVEGPVVIRYQTTVDLSKFAIGTGLYFRNHGELTDGEGHKDSDSAESTNLTCVSCWEQARFWQMHGRRRQTECRSRSSMEAEQRNLVCTAWQI